MRSLALFPCPARPAQGSRRQPAVTNGASILLWMLGAKRTAEWWKPWGGLK